MLAKSRQIVLSAFFVAMGVIVPILFHSFGGGGRIFLPMHIPVLLGGLVLSPVYAMLVGVMTPIVSGLTTGMPVVYPMMIIMAFELATYGLLMAYLTQKLRWPVIGSLLLAMIGGRIVAGIVVAVLVLGFGLEINPVVYLVGAVSSGLPGIILQLILIPLLAPLIKGRMIERAY